MKNEISEMLMEVILGFLHHLHYGGKKIYTTFKILFGL